MKSHMLHPFRSLTLPLAVALASGASGADRFWDGGTTNIGTDGNDVSTYSSGTWDTTLLNWDAGASPHVAWNNANLDTAIFGGTYSTATKTVTVTSAVTVNQIKILTGDSASATSANRLDITSTGVGAITFGGTYSTTTPSIDASATNVRNTQFAAKITGNLAANGGLVIAHGSDGTSGTSGRIFFGNAGNDFTGDVTMVSGNLHIQSNLGNSANKLVLAGGSLFNSAGTQAFSRDILVSTNSGINFTVGGTISDLTGTITGAANLTRYTSNTANELRFSGSMSGFSGLVDNTGLGMTTIQTTATSGGSWKLTGGTVKLNAANNDAIAHGAGKSDLLMNGGTLDMNGKSETINGLNGATGIVQNQATSTTSTLTLGEGDATATFGGTLRNNSGTGGTLALTKIGSGTQTLSGTNTATGTVRVEAGTLALAATTGLASDLILGTGTGGTGALDVTAKSGFTQANLSGNGIVNIGDGKTVGIATTLSPGFSVGTLSIVGNLALGGTTTMELGGNGGVAGADSDLAEATGTITLADILDIISYGAYDLTQPAIYQLFEAGSFGGDFTSVSVGGNALTFSNNAWAGDFDGSSYSFDETNGVLTVVPEPAVALLGGVGLLALLRRRHR